jgi:tRNA A37 threonylcarbamoyladenosine biosynthesis protein TsaE
MKKLFALLAAVALSGCVVVIEDNTYVQSPAYVQVCRWVDVPVYGHVDLYRDRDTTVRIKQTAYVDRQWRCN